MSVYATYSEDRACKGKVGVKEMCSGKGSGFAHHATGDAEV